MPQERFRETGKDSFFGDLVYDRVVSQDHFLRKLREVVDWRPFTKKLVRYYKGWFRTGDGVRCDPLTLTDAYSRVLLRCAALSRPTYEAVRPIFEDAFGEYGLPRAIRTDNGPPFAACSVAGLSALSLWWLKLGIIPERIAPGHPEQNGRHERMHRTLLYPVAHAYRTQKQNGNKAPWLRLVADPDYPAGLRERPKGERPFGEAKECHGFRRCR